MKSEPLPTQVSINAFSTIWPSQISTWHFQMRHHADHRFVYSDTRHLCLEWAPSMDQLMGFLFTCQYLLSRPLSRASLHHSHSMVSPQGHVARPVLCLRVSSSLFLCGAHGDYRKVSAFGEETQGSSGESEFSREAQTCAGSESSGL